MSNWISSKLKVAETFLQQIDQQAASSIGKNDKSRSEDDDDGLISDSSSKNGGGIVPLKDQLKKKAQQNVVNYRERKLDSNNQGLYRKRDKYAVATAATFSSSADPTLVMKPGPNDNDWTKLLGTSKQSTISSAKQSNGIQNLRKGGRKQGNLESHLVMGEAKKSPKKYSSGNAKILSERPVDSKVDRVSLDGRLSDGKESGSSCSPQRASTVEADNDDDNLKGIDASEETGDVNIMIDSLDNKDHDKNDDQGFARHLSVGDIPLESGSTMKMGSNDDHNKVRSASLKAADSNASLTSLVSGNLKRSSSINDDDRDSDSADSGSTSDSESEGEREERRRRRAQFLAERAAIKAAEAIKERENIVAKMEGEKQSLEKILEERAKQQAQEASELQITMMETMDAVELEKQKHSDTRMKALSRLARLETANADLARSLASVQWSLEIEVNRVTELRQQIEQKEVVLEDIERKISNFSKTGMFPNQLVALKGEKFGQDLLEAEYSFVADKVLRLQDMAKQLEANIELTRKEIANPTEVEVELKKRLGQLTDHLIQKQTQVETLSSEKASLLFGIEAISRMLDENKSMLNITETRVDIESGTWEVSNSKLKHSLENKVRTGRKHLGSLIYQLDSLFSAGVVFLRRNPSAKWWSLVYLLFLHFWVFYILTSHSQVSGDGRSGAVISLENINNPARI